MIFASGAGQERPRDVFDSLFLRKPYRATDVIVAFDALTRVWSACPNEIKAVQLLKTQALHPRVSWAPLP